MTQKELFDLIAGITGEKRTVVESVLHTLGDVICDVTEKGNGQVPLPRIGKFYASLRAPRSGRNPKTGEPVSIPTKFVPRFRPAKHFRDAVA
ncbi:MAG: HU family DNA-binding protein [Candidatus Accumulibacter sp.]|nr:HU family DNA-binding protein [Accumulibacter sp.]